MNKEWNEIEEIFQDDHEFWNRKEGQTEDNKTNVIQNEEKDNLRGDEPLAFLFSKIPLYLPIFQNFWKTGNKRKLIHKKDSELYFKKCKT